MGNSLYRPHHSRFGAAAMRARVNKDQGLGQDKNTVTMVQKALFSTGQTGSLLSFSDYKTSKKPKTIETGLSIHRDSVKLVLDSETNLYGLSFTCDSKEDFQIVVYYYAKELINTKTKSQYLSLDKTKSPSPVSLTAPAGLSQEILTSPVLDIKKFSQSDLAFEDCKTFPIVLFLKTQHELLLSYYKIEGDSVIKIRESYSVGDKSYEVFELYGSEYAECGVCLAESKRQALFPCRHVCVCQDCLDMIMKRDRKCPMCRTYIRGGYSLHL